MVNVLYDHKFEDLTKCTIIKAIGGLILLDNEDAHRIKTYKWHIRHRHAQRYAVRKVTGRGGVFYVSMHRQIMRCPGGLVVHHVNRNGLDNRKKNLKVCGRLEHHDIHNFCEKSVITPNSMHICCGTKS